MSHICHKRQGWRGTHDAASRWRGRFFCPVFPKLPDRRTPAVAQPSANLADETVQPFTADGLPRTLWWDDGAGVLRMIDQTRLPGEVAVLSCATSDEVAE